MYFNTRSYTILRAIFICAYLIGKVRANGIFHFVNLIHKFKYGKGSLLAAKLDSKLPCFDWFHILNFCTIFSNESDISAKELLAAEISSMMASCSSVEVETTLEAFAFSFAVLVKTFADSDTA